MASAATLVAIILAANGTDQYPARIGTSAEALSAQADTRFSANPAVLSLSQALEADSTTGGVYDASSSSLTSADAEVFSFFLENSTAVADLRCVEWPGHSAAVPARGEARCSGRKRTLRLACEDRRGGAGCPGRGGSQIPPQNGSASSARLPCHSPPARLHAARSPSSVRPCT